MLHPDTQLKFISPEVGYGIVATKLIPKGTITWILDPLDQVFTQEQIRKMHPHFQEILDKYSYRERNGDYVLCWDHAKYINHSFNSSCISTVYDFELAVRDIQPGEELTDDYGYLNLSEPFACQPEPNTTRTMVMPDDLLYFHEEWDVKLKNAFKNFSRVKQPFLELIDAKYKEKVLQVAAGRTEMDSILNLYYDGAEIAP
jgi:hypothetical protein